MKYVLCFVVLLSFSCKPNYDLKTWPTGRWKMNTSDSTYLLEDWKKINDHLFEGKVYSISPSDTILVEEIGVLNEEGELLMKPKVVGQNNGQEVVFTLSKMEDGKYVFENNAHDFPNVIWYYPVNAQTLQAGIEDKEGKIKQTFIYEKVD